MTQDSGLLNAIQGRATSTSIEREMEPESSSRPTDGRASSTSIPPETMKMLMHWTEMQANFGPDPDTAKVLAETERHSEDNRLKAYQANLDKQDRQNQRDQEYRLAQMKQAQRERYIVLIASLAALVVGAVLNLKGDSSLGNSIMIAALTLLSVLVSGKIKIGN